MSPACGRDTNQKMKHGLHRDSRISLSRIHFFDNIESMILGFLLGFCRICKCLGTSFLVYDGDVFDRMLSDAFQKMGVPKHSRIHENPDRNPITIYPLKKSVKKSNPCSLCNPCLNYCPSPQADGHIVITDIIFSWCFSSLCDFRQKPG